MIKAWLLDEMFRCDRTHLTIEGTQGGNGVPAIRLPQKKNFHHRRQTWPRNRGMAGSPLAWDPVPDAMYYNLYFQTTKGVMIKFSDLTRPIAGNDDFKAVIGVKKIKAPVWKAPRVRLSMTIWPTGPATTTSSPW